MENFKIITSKDNSLIKLVCGLRDSTKERKKQGLFVLEGLRICLDAYENGIKFDKLIVSESAYAKLFSDIEKFATVSEKCYLLPDSLFEKIASTDSPQGISIVAKIKKAEEKISPNGRYIGLENLSDPSNLGAIARTAEALGVSGILISKGSVDPYSPKVLRASMGTLIRMPLFVCDDLCETIKENRLNPYACVVDADATPINTVDFKDGDILLIGNEANGLTDETKAKSKPVTIKMSGKAESLNAAAAAAIAMWEMVKK